MWLYLKKDNSKIYGFYTLSSASIERKDVKGPYPYPLISAALIESSNNIAVNVIVTDAKTKVLKISILNLDFKN